MMMMMKMKIGSSEKNNNQWYLKNTSRHSWSDDHDFYVRNLVKLNKHKITFSRTSQSQRISPSFSSMVSFNVFLQWSLKTNVTAGFSCEAIKIYFQFKLHSRNFNWNWNQRHRLHKKNVPECTQIVKRCMNVNSMYNLEVLTEKQQTLLKHETRKNRVNTKILAQNVSLTTQLACLET